VNSTVPLLFFLLLPPPAAAASCSGVRAHPDTIAWRKFGTFGLSKSTCVATSTSSEPARQRCVSRCAHTMAPAAGQVPLARAVQTCRLRHITSCELLDLRHRDQLSNASCALGRRHNAASTTHTCTPHRKDCHRHTAAKTSPPTPSVPDTTRLTGSHAESSLAPAAPESAGNASASAPACLGATLDDSPAQAHTPQETPCRGSGLPTHDTGTDTDTDTTTYKDMRGQQGRLLEAPCTRTHPGRTCSPLPYACRSPRRARWQRLSHQEVSASRRRVHV
jgi:hypothetical protein